MSLTPAGLRSRSVCLFVRPSVRLSVRVHSLDGLTGDGSLGRPDLSITGLSQAQHLQWARRRPTAGRSFQVRRGRPRGRFQSVRLSVCRSVSGRQLIKSGRAFTANRIEPLRAERTAALVWSRMERRRPGSVQARTSSLLAEPRNAVADPRPSLEVAPTASQTTPSTRVFVVGEFCREGFSYRVLSYGASVAAAFLSVPHEYHFCSTFW